jgi:hypothetical protein
MFTAEPISTPIVFVRRDQPVAGELSYVASAQAKHLASALDGYLSGPRISWRVCQGVPLDFKSKDRPFRIREGRELAGRDQVADELRRTAHDSCSDSQRDRWATPLGGLDRCTAEVQVCVPPTGFEFATVNHAKDGPLADTENLGGVVCGNPANLIG